MEGCRQWGKLTEFVLISDGDKAAWWKLCQSKSCEGSGASGLGAPRKGDELGTEAS